MSATFPLTPYASVNDALRTLLTNIPVSLGTHLIGVYLSGSLALGDFDPGSSDIDLLVVTDAPPSDAQLAALRAMHEEFDASPSPWVGKVEVVYIDRTALRRSVLDPFSPDQAPIPQVERERDLFLDRLEDGWLSQCVIVREHGVTLYGPNPQTLIPPIDPDAMRHQVARIPAMWLDEAHNDPTWLEWLGVRQNQAFVTLTLCRLLYTLELGAVASKPAAARWVQTVLGEHWTGLIERALTGQHDPAPTPEADMAATIALIEYTVEQFSA